MRMGGLLQRSARIAAAVSETFRALPLWAPAALVCAPAALAQSAPPATLDADIPAQPLAQALASFANQTGLELVYVSGVMRKQRSRAAQAGLSADQALARMLQGTGLRFEYLTPRSIRILSSGASPAAGTTRSGQMEEVLVTANRRAESVQDVPITVQVLTENTVDKLNVRTFDDFVSYLPGVTAHGVGPAQDTIYVRGLGTTEWSLQAAGTGAPYPTVAIYLDEQSAQLPDRNLDVYVVDLERIEVLEGPQGTLFGAGAEAGVLRYITNKPKLDASEVSLDGGYGGTAHGGASRALDAVVNFPFLTDRLAVRGVVYDEKRGGYIDNTPATFARAPTDVSIEYFYGGHVPAKSAVINNSAWVADNINPVTYQGARGEVLYKLSEDWSVLLAQSYQSIEADGVFAEAATNSLGQAQPDLTVQLFNPSYDKDRFESTALTVGGRIGPLDLLYAGSYLLRNVEQIQDYTNYARHGFYASYYQCVNLSSTAATAQCFSPSSTWRDVERNTHESHELRLTTPADWRLRGVGGLYYEKYAIHDESDWFYLTATPYFNPIAPPTGYCAQNGRALIYCPPPPTTAVFVPGAPTSNDPNARPPGDAFFNDVTRGYTQKAAYASVDFELVPRVLTLTAGTRYSDTQSTEVGSVVGSFGCSLLNPAAAPVPDPCINRLASNLNALGLDRAFSGLKSRLTLSWKASGDALLYYTWSQGFRPGGFNRVLSGIPPNSPLYPGDYSWQMQAKEHGGWTIPLYFSPDSLTNNEVGWKTTWLDQRLQWNGTLYQEVWDNAQVSGDGSESLAGLVLNGGRYQVRGLETSAAARLREEFTLEAGAAWNHSALVREATLYWADGAPIDFALLQTSSGGNFPNPTGTRDTPLAGAPGFQGNLRLRYELALDGYNAFAQVGAVHQSGSFASTDPATVDLQGNSTYYKLPAFTTYDAALGVERDGWRVQLYGQNLSDTRAELYANYSLFYKAVTVNRPRTIGLHVSYRFRG